MELLYLYIEDDGKNIKNCEFNFSSEYHFSYDKEEKLITSTKNMNYISNFWDTSNIYNITAIIGKNGSGKSNLFKFLANGAVQDDTSLIQIFGEDNKITIYTNQEIKYNGVIKEKIIIKKNKNPPTPAHPIVYYSSSFYQDIYLDLFKNKSSVDISLKSIINIGMQNHSIYGTNAGSAVLSMGKTIPLGGALYYYQYETTLRHLDFINSYPLFHLEGINLPKFCRIIGSIPIFNQKVNKTKKLKGIIDNVSKLFLNSYNTEKNRDDNYKAFWYESLFFELYSYCLDLDLAEKANNFIKTEKALHYRTFTYLFFNKLSSINKNTKEINSLFQQLDAILEDIQTKPESNVKESMISIADAKKILTTYYSLLSKYNNDIANKYSYQEIYKGELYFEQYFKIVWQYPLSSGEETFIDFLSNLHYAKSQVNNTAKRITLILDEPELSLHPDLQRKFINILIEICPIIFKDFKLQILIASHSPILASDFPKNNIIFLDRDAEGNCRVIDSINRDNTFGANIHTLYRNSFFLNGLPIGEFAKKKINKLFNELEQGHIRTTTLQEIQMIGEPLLKNQLMKLYKQHKDLPQNTNNRIAQLEEEVRILKSKLDDKN